VWAYIPIKLYLVFHIVFVFLVVLIIFTNLRIVLFTLFRM